MKVDLTDLEEDILTVAKQNPDMTNKEIAEELDCSASWVGEVRGKYESKVPEGELPDNLNGSNSSNGGSLLGALLFLCVELPVRISIWMVEVTLKVTFWMIALPFRILDALFGSSN